MKLLFACLVTTMALFFTGCKKCDIDDLAGVYTISGTREDYYRAIDSTGDNWHRDITPYFDTISVTKKDDNTISVSTVSVANGYSSELTYQKKISTMKECVFTAYDVAHRSDTLRFFKNQHRIKLIHIYGYGYSNTTVSAEGIMNK